MTTLLADTDVLVRWTDHSFALTGSGFLAIWMLAFLIVMVREKD